MENEKTGEQCWATLWPMASWLGLAGPCQQRCKRAHGAVTTPRVPVVARPAGARRRPRNDEVCTSSTGVVWCGDQARWWGRGCTEAALRQREAVGTMEFNGGEALRWEMAATEGSCDTLTARGR
jgi:hypothetical protein